MLGKNGFFSIDVPAFLWGKNKFYGTAELFHQGQVVVGYGVKS